MPTGDEPASEEFKRAIVAILPRLRRFCASIAGGIDAGDDLLQSTVERALARSGQWQAGSRLDSWMFRIAQNIGIDQARTRKSRGVQVDVDALAEQAGEDGRETVEHRSDLAAARTAFASLPEEQRMVMALVVIDGRSYRETADMLDIPIGSVMSRLARARQAIGKHMGKGERDNGDDGR